MTKLYYTSVPGGSAVIISAIAAGVHLDVERVCIETHKTASDVDFYTINPKGNIPCLVLDDGTILNESLAVLQYIADQNPNIVAPQWGTLDRYLVVNILGFLISEVQPLLKEAVCGPNGDIKAEKLQLLGKKFAYLEKFVLKDQVFLVGNKFSIADAVLFMVLHLDQKVGFDLASFPLLQQYRERVGELPEVVAAQKKEEENPTSI